MVKNVPEDYFFATTPRYYCNELVEFPKVHSIAIYLVWLSFDFFSSLRSTSYNPYDDYSIRYNEVDSDWNKDKNHFEEINNDIGWKPFSDSPKNLERPQVSQLFKVMGLVLAKFSSSKYFLTNISFG